MVLVVHMYVIFLSLYLFEAIFFDLLFNCVDVVGGLAVFTKIFTKCT